MKKYCLLFLLMPAIAQAGTVTLAWEKYENPNAQIVASCKVDNNAYQWKKAVSATVSVMQFTQDLAYGQTLTCFIRAKVDTKYSARSTTSSYKNNTLSSPVITSVTVKP